MTLQGFDWSTGSTWSQNCYGVGTGHTMCTYVDSAGNTKTCTYGMLGTQCF